MTDNPSVQPVAGFTVVKLEVGADPAKGENWLEEQRKHYPKEDFEREFLLKPVGEQDSFPVFADYSKQHHENPELGYKRHLQYVYRGWDFGKVHPCVEFMQAEHDKVNVIYELYGTNIFLQQFAEQVLADSGLYFPGAKFVDWGDASGVNQRDDGRSSHKVLKDLGITLRFRRREVEEGISDITKYLVAWSEGRPKLQVNPVRCPKLAEAMRGGYRRKPNGILLKDGENDHPVDAFRYAFYGIVHNINATIIRSKPKKLPVKERPLTDCELFTRNKRV